MKIRDLYWLAGILEGEGCFSKPLPSKPNSPIITLQMTDEDVVARVAKLFGTKYCRTEPRHTNWKPVYTARLRGKRAIDIMQLLRPIMGLRRGQRIDEILALYKGNLCRKLNSKQVLSIRKAINNGESQIIIAKQFNISRSLVAMIATNKRHIIPPKAKSLAAGLSIQC